MVQHYKRIVIKIGSNVLTKINGLPDLERIAHLTSQIATIKKQGIEIILVSSGAVASGRSAIKTTEKADPVAARQLLAAVGQVKLINTYDRLFEKHATICAQVLVTREDFRDRLHYLNMKNCLEILLEHQVIPIVNENDVVSVTELMFTDNDELAGLIAAMMDAQALIVLTNVDGIFNGDPSLAGTRIIEKVDNTPVDFSKFITSSRSQFGRGGMLTKAAMAQKLAGLGIAVHIANGTKNNIINDVLNNEAVHTCFVANKIKTGKKKWIAHSGTFATGVVQVNQGAKDALVAANATSLLPVGVINILSDFKKGEVIRLVDEHEREIGLGIAEYSSDKARENMGHKNRRVLVHYDYLYLQ